MSSTIYNHRSLQPQGPPPPVPAQPQAHSPARLNESLEIVRQEFELVTQDLNLFRAQRDDFENKISAQVNELNIIKQTLYELESQHSKVRQQYEDEVNRLRAELSQARQAVQVHPQGIPPHPSAVAGPPGGPGIGGAGPPPSAGPPGSGPGPGIGPGASPHPAHAGMAPPASGYNEPYYRDRERGEPRERGRDEMRDLSMRDRDMRDRDRELRDRDARDVRDRELLAREAARDRDREREVRDAKRIKTERGKNERLEYTPSQSHKYPEPGPSSSTLVPSSTGMSRPGAGSTGVVAPQQPQQQPPPESTVALWAHAEAEAVAPELKKQGPDWYALFNPEVKRSLDVSLVHTLTHESVVCCVRFSADGKFLATGCNRTAQIYDTKTGAKTCVLYDESAPSSGDLYIRSVCFSPDGKSLATGAEDKQIRIWDISKRRIRRCFEGHQQEIYSLDFSKDGRLIVSGSGDRTARIWDMETGSQKVLEINEPEGVDAGVTSVAISHDGRFVAAGSLDNIVRIWDVQTGHLVERLKGHEDSVYSVAFTPDGKGLVSGSLDRKLKHWDLTPFLRGNARKDALPPATPVPPTPPVPNAIVRVQEGGERGSSCTLNFDGHNDFVLSVAVSHDGQWVVSGSKDRSVLFWDARTAQAQFALHGHKNSVISIDLSPTGGILATGSGDWHTRIWSYTLI